MNSHDDIEKALREFHHEPGAKTRRSIMAAYRSSMDGHGNHHLWARRIPLYAVAACLVVATALSFFAGHYLGGSAQRRASWPENARESASDLTWNVAERDLL